MASETSNMSKIKIALQKSIEANKKSNIDKKSDEEYFIEEFKSVNLKGGEANLAQLDVLHLQTHVTCRAQ